MKASIIAVAIIFLFGIFAYATDEHKCASEYHKLISKINALSHSEMSQENKDKWKSKLKQVYELCKEGKDQEAAEIMAELNEDKAHDLVFNPATGNQHLVTLQIADEFHSCNEDALNSYEAAIIEKYMKRNIIS